MLLADYAESNWASVGRMLRDQRTVMKPLVLVTWDDAEDPADGKTWLDEEDVDTFSQHRCTVQSVGFLVSKTDKYVTLGGDWIEELKHWGRITKIPSGMIVETKDLQIRES